MENPHTPRFTYSFAYIARRLGIENHTRAWQSKRVRALIENGTFPEPLPTAGAWRCRASHWDRRAVDAWFDGLLQAPVATRAADQAAQHAAQLLDARAERIFA